MKKELDAARAAKAANEKKIDELLAKLEEEKLQRKKLQEHNSSLQEQLSDERDAVAKLKKTLQDKDKQHAATTEANLKLHQDEKESLENIISQLRESLNKLRYTCHSLVIRESYVTDMSAKGVIGSDSKG